MNTAIQTLNTIRTGVGESARWNINKECLFWIDTQQPYLFSYKPQNKTSQSYPLPAPLNCIDTDSNGDLIGIMSNALVKITILNKTAEINYLKTNLIHDDSVAFNDGLLDQKGHLWVGTMDKSFQNNTGSLYRISSSGEIVMMDEGFYISNGMGWSPNNEKFYFVDSLARVIYEYHFNVEKCNIDKRRILIEFTEDQGFPDGLYIDKMGYIWVAGWASYKVYQYSPKGELINSVQFPAKNLTSCCFGGHNLKTLFVTSASFDVLSNIKDVGEPAGSVFILN